jgi:nucleoside-diphosphate-sugar epimerase
MSYFIVVMAMERVLVTGGVGFIGSHLARHLLQCGGFVRAQAEGFSANKLVRLMNFYDINKKGLSIIGDTVVHGVFTE